MKSLRTALTAQVVLFSSLTVFGQGAPFETDVDEVAELIAAETQYMHGIGYDVDLAGHTAVLGATELAFPNLGPGSAYVFARGGTSWSQQAKLNASDGLTADSFGWGVGVDGNVIVGAPRNDPGAGLSSGAAYVYERTGSIWTETAKLVPSDATFAQRFGEAAAVHGDTIVVGAPFQPTLTGVGAAYVFVRGASGWEEEAKLVGDDTDDDDLFGRAVAVDGDRVIVGAEQTVLGSAGPGAAYVFARTGGIWSQETKLTASDGVVGDAFGVSVDVEGANAVVGSPGSGGAAYIFLRDETDWSQHQKLTASDGADDGFGASVSLSGEKIAVGAPTHDQLGATSGAVYLFELVAQTVWVETADFANADSTGFDEFGTDVAIEHTTILGGAPFATGAVQFSGSAYVFEVDYSELHCQGDNTNGFCPCINFSTFGSGFGCRNSTGEGAGLGATGTNFVTLDDMGFRAVHLPPGEPAVLFAGTTNQNGGAGLAFNDGLRCARGEVIRLGVQIADGSGGATWDPGVASGFAAGDIRIFQAWYRDPGGPCGTGSNLTNAQKVTFGP